MSPGRAFKPDKKGSAEPKPSRSHGGKWEGGIVAARVVPSTGYRSGRGTQEGHASLMGEKSQAAAPTAPILTQTYTERHEEPFMPRHARYADATHRRKHLDPPV